MFYLDCEFEVEPASKRTYDSPGDPGGVYLTDYQVVAIDNIALLNPKDRQLAKEKLELSKDQQQNLEDDHAESISEKYVPSDHHFW